MSSCITTQSATDALSVCGSCNRTDPTKTSGVRLVNRWNPIRYDLDIAVDLSQWQTVCTEVITFEEVLDAGLQETKTGVIHTSTVSLHCGASIEVESAVIVAVGSGGSGDNNNAQHADVAFVRDTENETIVFGPLPASIVGSEATAAPPSRTFALKVTYKNKIQDELRGFYRCTYTSTVAGGGSGSDGERCRMASTHFEPAGARLMYLCVDEPAARAAFRLTARLPAADGHLKVISNGLEVEQHSHLSGADVQPSASQLVPAAVQAAFPVVRCFEETPLIPPYLTALVVGDLEGIRLDMADFVHPEKGPFTTNALGTAGAAAPVSFPVTMYAVKGKAHRGRFSLLLAAHALDFFANYFSLDEHKKSTTNTNAMKGGEVLPPMAPYPVPSKKLDLVAVPDFPIGGMENWGCICLVESVLLADDAIQQAEAQQENGAAVLNAVGGVQTITDIQQLVRTSGEAFTAEDRLRRVGNLVTHEVAHTWFGNLVGIDWWEGLWLKEGFASWAGAFGSAAYFKKSSAFLSSSSSSTTEGADDDDDPNAYFHDELATIMDAMDTDAYLQATHAVEVPIARPADVKQIFDAISYNKGMALVVMLRDFLNSLKRQPQKEHSDSAAVAEDFFSRCIGRYLAENAFGNTVTDGLWASIEGSVLHCNATSASSSSAAASSSSSSSSSVTAMMRSFSKRVGHPIVNASVLSVEENTTSSSSSSEFEVKVQCTQRTFSYGSVADSEAGGWIIPLHVCGFAAATGQTLFEERLVLDRREHTFTIAFTASMPIAGKTDIGILINPYAYGFYRVAYADEGVQVAQAAQFSTFSPLAQRVILHQAAALFKGGSAGLPFVVSLLDQAVRLYSAHTLLQSMSATGLSPSEKLARKGAILVFLDAVALSGQLHDLFPAGSKAVADGAPLQALHTLVQGECVRVAEVLCRLAPGSLPSAEARTLRSVATNAALGALRRQLRRALEPAKTTTTTGEGGASYEAPALLAWAAEAASSFLDPPPTDATAPSRLKVVDSSTLVACLGLRAATSTTATAALTAQLLQIFPRVEGDAEAASIVLSALCKYSDNVELLDAVMLACASGAPLPGPLVAKATVATTPHSAIQISSQWGNLLIIAFVRNAFFNNKETANNSNLLWSSWRRHWVEIDRQWGQSQFRLQRMITTLAHHCKAFEPATTSMAAVENKKVGQEGEETVPFAAFFEANPCPVARLDILRGRDIIELRNRLA